MNKFKITQSETVLLNALVSILGSAALTALTAVYQLYVSSAGKANLLWLALVFLISFGVLVYKDVVNYVPGHAQQEIAAGHDFANQLLAQLASAQSTVEAMAKQSPLMQQAITQASQIAAQTQNQPVAPVVNVFTTPNTTVETAKPQAPAPVPARPAATKLQSVAPQSQPQAQPAPQQQPAAMSLPETTDQWNAVLNPSTKG